MLYNPKWEVKADPLANSSLIAWLESWPDGEVYPYHSPWECMLTQYFAAAYGTANIRVFCNSFVVEGRSRNLPEGWDWIADTEPRTFGGALKRARRLMGELKCSMTPDGTRK